MNANGTDTTNVSNDPGVDAWPAWSPDGSKIAFSSTRNGDTELYVMNADGTDQTPITNMRYFASVAPAGRVLVWSAICPDWSPDGNKIAFAVTDLPEPDSPTMHSISPLRMSKDMFSTAFCRSMFLGRRTVRFRTERTVWSLGS